MDHRSAHLSVPEEPEPTASESGATRRTREPGLPGSARVAAASLVAAWPSVRRALERSARLLLLAALEVALVAVLAALPALFFWRVLATAEGDVATFTAGDFTDLHYPYRRFVADQLALGRLPVWNPYVSAGHPSLGDVQFAALYPIGALLASWAGAGMPFVALEQQVLLHFSLAGVFTYLLGRRLLSSRAGALIAALVFAYGGYLTSFPVQQMIILQTSVWLPLILLLLDFAIVWRSPAAAIPAGLALAMAALAGHPQTLFYVLLGAGLYFAYRCWDRGLHVGQALVGVVFLGLGLGLAAPALAPAYEHLQLTGRAETDYQFTTSGFAFHELFGIVVPYRFGGQALYQGIFPLVLAGAALGSRSNGRTKGFWLLVAVVALLLSFGGSTFLQSLMYVGLPPAKFRDHERFSFLVGLAMAMLAGYGVDSLLRQSVDRDALRRYARGLAIVLAVLLGFATLFLYGSMTGYPEVRGSFSLLADRAFFSALLLALSVGLILVRVRSPQLQGWPLLAVLLVAVDLFSTNWQLNLRPGDPAKLYPQTAAVAYLQTSAFGLYRIASEGLLPGDGNAGSAYRLEDVVGNSPLELGLYQRFTKDVGEWQRWRLLNVRFLITKRNLDGDGRFRLVTREGDVSTYEIKEAHRLPRAWVVHRTTFAGSSRDALALLNGIDPAVEAVVEDEAHLLGAGRGDDAPAPGSARAPVVEIVEREPDRLTLQASLDRPGVLVLSEIHHPDWVATVDGAPAPILRVNGMLRGLALGPGRHEARMEFRSSAHLVGLELATKARQLAVVALGLELALRLVLLSVPPAYRLARRALARGRRPAAAEMP